MTEETKTLQIFPFSSKRKRSSCIIDSPNANKSRILLKGDPKIILNDCTAIHSLNDKVLEITPDLKEKILNQIDKMESQALKTVIFAYKDFDSMQGILF